MIPLKSFQNNLKKNQLFFERGLIGYPDHKNFDFFPLSDKGLNPLKMIVSIDPVPLSFILIDENDIKEKLLTSKEKEIFYQDIPDLSSDYNISYIATFQKSQNKIQLSINLRAPLIIEMRESSDIAWQYILPFSYLNTKFPLLYIAQYIEKQLKAKNKS